MEWLPPSFHPLDLLPDNHPARRVRWVGRQPLHLFIAIVRHGKVSQEGTAVRPACRTFRERHCGRALFLHVRRTEASIRLRVSDGSPASRGTRWLLAR